MNDNNHHTHHAPLRSTNVESEDLLGTLKGRGPREVLNALAPGRLTSAMIQATVGTLLVMALLTVGPYLLAKPNVEGDNKPAAKTPEKKEEPNTTKVEPKKDGEPKPTDKPADKTTAVDNKKDQAKPSKDVIEKLKENDVKKDKPKDPFSNIDDLLDKK